MMMDCLRPIPGLRFLCFFITPKKKANQIGWPYGVANFGNAVA